MTTFAGEKNFDGSGNPLLRTHIPYSKATYKNPEEYVIESDLLLLPSLWHYQL